MSSLAPSLALDHASGTAHSHALVESRPRAAIVAATALATIAPFEFALGTIPGGFTVTTVEAALAVALSIGGFAIVRARRPIAWPGPLVFPGAVFLAAILIAALAAPVESHNALRFVARMAIASMVCLLFATLTDTIERARSIVRAIVGVATVIGAVAVLEAAQVQPVMSALTVFRPGFHVVGGQLRATSTLLYPTIASMYLEIAFALGLWLLLDPASLRPRLERRAAFVALTIIGAGISATFTRAGLVGMAAALTLTAGIRLARMPRAQARLGTIGHLATVLAGVGLMSHSPALWATRLTTDGAQAWYGARYDVPKTLRLTTGRTHRVPIGITNTGRLTWDSQREPAFAMSYHWLRAGSEAVIQFDGERTPFPSAVSSGSKLTMPVFVTAPAEPGPYTLVWDAVHESRAWFSTEGVPFARTEVRVEGARSGSVVTRMDRLPRVSIRPARPELWKAAIRIAADRPWLGVGPDNFRHVYGGYAGLERWDPRIHANNMYLEVLAGGGMAACAALIWLVTAAGLALLRRCLSIPVSRLMPVLALLTAWLMVAGHGLVDSFLSFTTTYVMFAIAAGIAFSRGFTAEADGLRSNNADRV